MPEGLLAVTALMIVGHFVADYPLQGEFLAKAKNRVSGIPGVPWYQALGAHAAIHGGAVGIATGSVLLGILETIAHAAIDDAKCRGKLSYDQDQMLHIGCKLVWVGILMALGRIP